MYPTIQTLQGFDFKNGVIMEIWKPIKEYEGLYEVSSFGNVRSIKRNTTNGKIMKLQKTKTGYYRVGLCKNNKVKCYSVHRLVAQAFIPNLNNLPQVNHKNECKTNNNVENLEWCTMLYNVRYGTGIERQAKARIGVKFTEERKKNISKSCKGRKPPVLTEEGRLKCSISAKKRWEMQKGVSL